MRFKGIFHGSKDWCKTVTKFKMYCLFAEYFPQPVVGLTKFMLSALGRRIRVKFLSSVLWIICCATVTGGAGIFMPRVALAESTSPALAQSSSIEPYKEGLTAFNVSADSVPTPLGGKVGFATSGAQIVRGRVGQCTLCHAVPGYTGQVGNLGPLLQGVGSRLTEAQLRLRVINSSLVNPDTIMPSYYKVDGLINVDPQWRGVPLMNEQQIEDVIAYLASLK